MYFVLHVASVLFSIVGLKLIFLLYAHLYSRCIPKNLKISNSWHTHKFATSSGFCSLQVCLSWHVSHWSGRVEMHLQSCGTNHFVRIFFSYNLQCSVDMQASWIKLNEFNSSALAMFPDQHTQRECHRTNKIKVPLSYTKHLRTHHSYFLCCKINFENIFFRFLGKTLCNID